MAGERAFVRQSQLGCLVWFEQGDKDVNAGTLESAEIIFEPITSTRAHDDGKPRQRSSFNPADVF